MTPKPLSDAVKKGFAYLAGHQDTGGGWSQGGGWRTADQRGTRVEGPDVQDPPDVANTCVATLALLRGGNGPRQGEYANNVARGLNFIISCVERADAESPYVTDVRGTQVQSKIGPYVDTFLTALVLAEASGQLPDPEGEDRLAAALDRVVAKMERHQQADGSWSADGWAPVVGQALGSAGLNRARQRGARVSDEALDRSEKYARGQYDPASKAYGLAGSPGVPLYSTASHLSASRHYLDSFGAAKANLRRTLKSKRRSPEDREKAAKRLQDIEEAEAAHAESLGSSIPLFKNKGFVSGFGSNGGEEFLSYLNVSETLAGKGGEEWQEWDQAMTRKLERVQNRDGSWSGHHCITGRTFCTATALLVLLADRIPRPDVVI
jgi:Prenyltransferase and squalene oxidase repeat